MCEERRWEGRAIRPPLRGASSPEAVKMIELLGKEVSISPSVGRDEKEPIRKPENKPVVTEIRSHFNR